MYSKNEMTQRRWINALTLCHLSALQDVIFANLINKSTPTFHGGMRILEAMPVLMETAQRRKSGPDGIQEERDVSVS